MTDPTVHIDGLKVKGAARVEAARVSDAVAQAVAASFERASASSPGSQLDTAVLRRAVALAVRTTVQESGHE